MINSVRALASFVIFITGAVTPPLFSRAEYCKHCLHCRKVSYSYCISTIDIDQCLISLDDGSIWQIARDDAYVLYHWNVGVPIVIKPGRWYTRHFAYRISALHGYESVSANLIAGPFIGGVWTYQITQKDPILQTVRLNDGTMWEVADKCMSTFATWRAENFIIFGVNDGLCAEHPNILINVSTNTFVYCKKTQY